jgi:hypothetical protein
VIDPVELSNTFSTIAKQVGIGSQHFDDLSARAQSRRKWAAAGRSAA